MTRKRTRKTDLPRNDQLLDGLTGGPRARSDARKLDGPASTRFDPAAMEEAEEATTIPDEKIVVGNGGIMSIPREDFDDDDVSEELGGSRVRIRKPGKREFFILNPALEWPTKLLVHKPKGPDSMEEELYWVSKALRESIRGELKAVRVFLIYSVSARRFALWVVKVTLGNDWYESLQDRLLRKPPDYFTTYEVCVKPDKESSRYRVLRRPRSVKVIAWPTRPIGDLMAEALGQSHIISTPDHPLYIDLTNFEEVD